MKKMKRKKMMMVVVSTGTEYPQQKTLDLMIQARTLKLMPRVIRSTLTLNSRRELRTMKKYKTYGEDDSADLE